MQVKHRLQALCKNRLKVHRLLHADCRVREFRVSSRHSKRDQLAKHQMELVGADLRDKMLWKSDANLDTASN